jgi:hypothetical protein
MSPSPLLRSFAIMACYLPATLCIFCDRSPLSAEEPASRDFDRDVKPILAEYCFGCHADGASEGNLSFDNLFSMADHDEANPIWYRVLKKLQSGLMPPPDEQRPSPDQMKEIANWIKYETFGLKADNPDPGRVTIRRLNQVEYANTVRDLLGVSYDTSANFPADDTGHGFDNIGDVLSMSPLLLEKYVNAADEIVSGVVPTVSGVLRERSVPGDQFARDQPDDGASSARRRDQGDLVLSYYSAASAQAVLDVEHPGRYMIRLNMTANETYVDDQFDENKCDFSFLLDDEILLQETFVRQGRRAYTFDFERSLTPGKHKLIAKIKPLTEVTQVRQLRLQLKSVDLIGPQDEQHYAKPAGYGRFFPRDVPERDAEKRAYARELLGEFAYRSFRRPVDKGNLDRLVALAESVYSDGNTFESGIAKSMTAILASPRFLFREEARSTQTDEQYPLIDEFALASRLSYFLWSTMPDQELIDSAESGTLRQNLDAQISRMLNHEKAKNFAKNFAGQWLRARVLDTIQINGAAILSREPSALDPEVDIRRQRFFVLFRKGAERTKLEEVEYESQREAYIRSFRGGSTAELTAQVRDAMRRETEMLFEYIVSDDRSLLELVDSDYTFLNEALWGHYQIEGIERVVGDEMRLVQLPAGSVRGGVLTQGTTLVVTSNPDRTSPVKRGLFILENLLGTPPSAPPPNIPALEDVEANPEEQLSLRKTLAIHRANALCSSCHNQMDPLGLALENFNALGRYRTEELGQPVDVAGVLNTGESFSSIIELKQILAETRQTDIFRCITEKMLTYALGRAVEYTDAHTVDELVSSLEVNGGRAQSLVRGIIYSSAFQRTRNQSQTFVRN